MSLAINAVPSNSIFDSLSETHIATHKEAESDIRYIINVPANMNEISLINTDKIKDSRMLQGRISFNGYGSMQQSMSD